MSKERTATSNPVFSVGELRQQLECFTNECPLRIGVHVVYCVLDGVGVIELRHYTPKSLLEDRGDED